MDVSLRVSVIAERNALAHVANMDVWGEINPRRRGVFVHFVGRHCRDVCDKAYDSGELGDAFDAAIVDQLAARAEDKIRGSGRYGSILTMLAIAVFVEIVKYLIRKFLENHFSISATSP